MKRLTWLLLLAVISAMFAAPVLSLAADAPADAPKAEVAKAPAPAVDNQAPAAAAPKAEAPKAEAPKAEAPAPAK